MPEPIDLFSLQNAGREIAADGAVGQSGKQYQVADQIIIAGFHENAPFNVSPAGLLLL